MSIFSVYLPPSQDKADKVENFRVLRDAKAPLALIFPPFWLAWHRLWLELIIYLAVALGISMLAVWKPLPPVLYLSAIPGLYLLLEGNELVRRKLERQGWKFAGVIDADNQEAAEIKFIVGSESHAGEDRVETTELVHAQNPPAKPLSAFTSAPAGLFPE